MRRNNEKCNKLYPFRIRIASFFIFLIQLLSILENQFCDAFSTINSLSSFLHHKPSRLLQKSRHHQSTELFFYNRATRLDEVRNNDVVNTIKSPKLFLKLKSIITLKAAEIEDGDDWNNLLSALEMYKAAYGDLKVPSRFVVPSSSPWPQPTWELKLGQRIALIRSTGKYIDNNEHRRKLLDDMGFVWRMRSPKTRTKAKTKSTLEEDGITINQIYTALENYRLHVDPEPVKIPDYFIVPNCDPWPEETRGLPLGKKLSIILKNIGYYMNEADKDIIPKLKSYGVEVSDYFVQQKVKKYDDGKASVNDYRWNNVYTALQTYKKIHGDLLISQPFVVPNDPAWPEDVWGLRLGARVNAIRSQNTFIKNNPERRQMLVDLGFVWDISGNRKKATRKKKKLQEEFPPIIPDDEIDLEVDDTPTATFEETFDLSKNYKVDSQFLQLQQEQQMKQQKKLEQELDEDSFVPERDFEDAIPIIEKNAIDVGIVQEVRGNSHVKKGYIDVKHPWFNDDFGDDFTFDDVVEALTVYKSINGNFDGLDDVEFVIPELEEEDRLGDLSDYFSGSSDATDDLTASASLAAQAIASMDDIERSSEVREKMIQDEIQRMQKEMNILGPGDLEMYANDTATATLIKDKQSWPEYLAGMKLGLIVRRIREGDLEVKHLPQRKEKLDAISFDWGDPRKFLDVPFEKTMCALFAYYMIRGDLFVYEDFIMPNEDPWPNSLAGFELGKAVFRIRAKQKMIEKYHPQKKYMLNMLEFVWFPLEYALPLDDEEEPLTWEQEQVRHVGHPLARINAPPLSAVEHVHPVDHPDAQDRYEFSYELVKDYYEKELGITDIGEYLRERGYMELADEHEAKYGKPTPVADGETEDDFDIDMDDEEEDFEYDDFDEMEDVDDEYDDDDIELDLDDEEESEEDEDEELDDEELDDEETDEDDIGDEEDPDIGDDEEDDIGDEEVDDIDDEDIDEEEEDEDFNFNEEDIL